MKNATKLIAIVISAALGGFLSRWHGGGFFKAAKILKGGLWALCFAASVAAIYYLEQKTWQEIAIAAGLVFAWSLIFKNTGHGGGMDLGTWTKPREDERLEFIVKPLRGKIPEYWYDALLLAIIGLFSTLGAAVALGLVNPLAALPLFIGGAGKALAYMVGWLIHETGSGSGPKDLNEATEIGETLTGVFAFVGLATAVSLCLT